MEDREIRIYKYSLGIPINVFSDAHVVLPKDAIIRSVGEQNGNVFLWAEVNYPIKLVEKRIFTTIATGQEYNMSENMRYIGTIHSSIYVSHVYELI